MVLTNTFPSIQGQTHPNLATASDPGNHPNWRLAPHTLLLVVGEVPAGSVLDSLRGRLARHLQPDRVATVPALTVGDVDTALARAQDVAPRRRASVTEASEAERRVGEIWAAVLGRPVGPDENFFDAGGTSLRLIRLRHELHRLLGVDVPLVDLFTYPTVSAMSVRFVDDGRGSRHPDLASICAAAGRRGRDRRSRQGRRARGTGRGGT